jgi:hypothetical protein
MDAHLMNGLSVPLFARQWKVSTRTVHRDLDAFRQLGQRMKLVYTGRETGGEVREYVWTYEEGVEPLFVCNSG